MEIAGNIITAAGIIFMFFGIIGIFRFNNFYERILVTAKIDTVGAMTLIVGIAVKHGAGFFSLKLLLLAAILLILNPLAAHILARSAYLSGYKIDDASNVKNHAGDEDCEEDGV